VVQNERRFSFEWKRSRKPASKPAMQQHLDGHHAIDRQLTSPVNHAHPPRPISPTARTHRKGLARRFRRKRRAHGHLGEATLPRRGGGAFASGRGRLQRTRREQPSAPSLTKPSRAIPCGASPKSGAPQSGSSCFAHRPCFAIMFELSPLNFGNLPKGYGVSPLRFLIRQNREEVLTSSLISEGCSTVWATSSRTVPGSAAQSDATATFTGALRHLQRRLRLAHKTGFFSPAGKLGAGQRPASIRC